MASARPTTVVATNTQVARVMAGRLACRSASRRRGFLDMAKIDVYLRSIERFGASGAILSSGQAVTLRLPQGDRQATQVTPHDQLVALVREIAPPTAIAQIDRNAPAKFDFESAGVRYALTVTPRQGALHVL